MPVITTPGLVLRRADYSDYDRMVTIFSPEMGRLDAIARGCRRPKSPLVNAVETFTASRSKPIRSGWSFPQKRLKMMFSITVQHQMRLNMMLKR